MSIPSDDKVLQEFLVEAGEILEKLAEQLVELEHRPTDYDLLNAIFRGFHTIKGGAGFLNLTTLVDVCHRAEDVFNSLRQGSRQLDAEMMDAVLAALDIVTANFNDLRSARTPTSAPAELLERLAHFAQPGSAPAPAPASAAPSANATLVRSEDLTDQEFEAMLDGMGSPAASVEKAPPSLSESITDEEFEALLDALNGGQGTPPPAAKPSKPSAPPAAKAVVAQVPAAVAKTEAVKSDMSVPVPVVHASTPAVPAPSSSPFAAPRADATPPVVESTVRVDTKRLDDLMNMVGELVLVRNRLVTLESATRNEAIANAVANIDSVTANLQLAVMKTRMQPIKKVFGRFPRLVRDLARNLNKDVNLELRGEDTDLDKNLVEALADPLVHLVRNAVDHGIETPERRAALGKSRTGTIILGAEQEGDHIRLSITDDGAGMDAEVLRRKVVEKGLMDSESAMRLNLEECYNLIFLPGFSTRSEISDVSGRGVGMDVVKTSIAKLNGVVDITSETGKGTSIVIKVPLTLAIMPTLMVKLAGQVFALPLACVAEILHLELDNYTVIDDQRVVLVREQALPVYYLRHWLIRDQRAHPWPDLAHVVVVNLGTQRIGFVVDELIGQEEVVIKPLGALLQGTRGLAGATITGDGRMALILDVPSLMGAYGRSYRPSAREVA